MTDQVHTQLRPVRRRQRWQAMVEAGATGLLFGACLAAAGALARWLGAPLPIATVWGICGAGAAVGAVAGLIWGHSWRTAAQAVDRHYELKDRTITALEFLHHQDPSVLEELEITDTVEHLASVDPGEVAPWRVPRRLIQAAASVAVVALLLWLPNRGARATAAPAIALPEVLQEAAFLEETMLEELDQLAKEQEQKELEELVEELKELVEEMKEPDVDERDALATLSEMQAAIAAALAEYNLEAVDAALEEAGDAVSSVESLQAASQALKAGEYDKAAEQLEKMDPSKITRKEAKSAASKLAKLAKKCQDGTMGELGECLGEMSEGFDCENEGQCKSGAKKLAGLCRSQGLRKGIGRCLSCQLAKLGECKGRCNGKKNGGNCVAKSDSPKNTWGTGASGQPLGDLATELGGNRERKNITGTAGEGPSEREVSHSADGRQDAGRSYREVYQEYQKMSEAVLESEPLPLGHRQTIRRYFELIRPSNTETDAAVETPDTPSATL